MKKCTSVLCFIYLISHCLIAQSQPLPTYVPQTGLVGWWGFNGNANDLSGNNYNCVVNGATLSTDRFNCPNEAYSFDGINDFLRVTNHSLPTGDDPVSISAWFNSNQYPGITSLAICSWGQWNYNSARYIGLRGSVSQPTFTYAHFLNDKDVPYFYPTNNWTHVVVTFRLDTIKLYVNGVLVHNSRLNVAPNTLTGVFCIGNSPGNTDHFNGKIDDVGIWNRALTATEVSQLFNAPNSFTITPITDKTVCQGDSVQLVASGGTSYSWTPANGLSNTSISNPWAKPLSTQQYIVSVSNGGCVAVDTVNVNITTLNADAGEDEIVCLGDSVLLTATGGNSYQWDNEPSLSSLTIFNPFAKPTISTLYKVKISNGICSLTDSVKVSVFNSTSISITQGNSISVCLNDSIQLNASNADTYLWEPSIGLSNDTIGNPQASPKLNTTYILSAKVGSCIGKDTITVSINSLPIVNAGVDTFKCKSEEIRFQPNVTGADVFRWEPSSLLDNATILTPSTRASTSQIFTLKATNTATTCSATDTVLLTIKSPVAQFTVADSVGLSSPFLVTTKNLSTPQPLSYKWEIFDSTKVLLSDFEPSHTFNQFGSFRILLTVTDQWGCTDTTSAFVSVLNEGKIFIPSVFSPNNDGTNDFFEIVYTQGSFKTIEGQIWNRWGGKIHEFRIPQNNWWDGKFEGKLASDEVYFYTVKTVDVRNVTRYINGTVTLLR